MKFAGIGRIPSDSVKNTRFIKKDNACTKYIIFPKRNQEKFQKSHKNS